MDRRLDWIASNGVLAAALYFAVVAQVPWVQYAITAFTWWMLANCATALLGDFRSRPIGPPTGPSRLMQNPTWPRRWLCGMRCTKRRAANGRPHWQAARHSRSPAKPRPEWVCAIWARLRCWPPRPWVLPRPSASVYHSGPSCNKRGSWRVLHQPANAQAMIFDLAVLAVMFAAHWYWTACAYAAMSGCAVLIRDRATSKH